MKFKVRKVKLEGDPDHNNDAQPEEEKKNEAEEEKSNNNIAEIVQEAERQLHSAIQDR